MVAGKWPQIPVRRPRGRYARFPSLAGADRNLISLAAHEKTAIEDALRAGGGRVFGPSGASVRLGIVRSTLASKIRDLGIDKNRFRGRRPPAA